MYSGIGHSFYELAWSGITCDKTCQDEGAFCQNQILAGIELWYPFDEQGINEVKPFWVILNILKLYMYTRTILRVKIIMVLPKYLT